MEKLSKSELKRQHKQVEDAAREIILLNDSEVIGLGIGVELVEAVKLCRSLKGGSLKRQIKFIAKLLKQEPVDEILALLAKKKGSKLEENKLQHQAERLRDAIINEALTAREHCLVKELEMDMEWPSDALAAVVAMYPGIDENELRRSAYQYVKSRNKVHQRELFRMLKAAAEKARFQAQAD